MGLFDDLLKKPNSSSSTDTSGFQPVGGSGGNPPTTDPLTDAILPPIIKIEKSEEVSIVTESAMNTATAEPPPVSSIAIDDFSSLLISSTPESSDEKDVFIPSTEISIPDTAISISTESANISPNANTSTITDDSIIHNSNTIHTETVGLISEDTTINFDNLFGSSSTPAETIAHTQIKVSETPTEVLKVSETPIEVVSDDSLIQLVSDISIETQTTNNETKELVIDEVSTPIINVEKSITSESIPLNPNPSDDAIPQVDIYEHPSDFIQSSIAKIDQMLAKIDAAHNAELEEALGYKTEKEKYTALEDQAYANAEKYVKEKEHALTMRSYFVEQGKIDITSQEKNNEVISKSPVASVETTLTGLSVQNALTEAVQPQKKSKTTKKEEESMGILGL